MSTTTQNHDGATAIDDRVEDQLSDAASSVLSEIADSLSGKKQKKKEFDDVDVRSEGNVITIPEGMTYAQAQQWLSKKEKQQEKWVEVNRDFNAFPHDGLVALDRAIKDVFGFAFARGFQSFFGESPPSFMDVAVSHDETVSVPRTPIEPPALDGGRITPQWKVGEGLPNFRVNAEVMRKYKPLLEDLFDRVAYRLHEDSIYQGKAIRLDLSYQEEGESFDLEQHVPRFMDLSSVPDETLILNDETQFAVDSAITSRVESTEAVQANGVPLRYGVLLKGPYGTGKTMTARHVAYMAEQNGWSFLYLDDPFMLPEALRLARLYEPCVVFAEDIDKAVAERDARMDEFLNALDGIDTKATDVITVLTTNHAERIDASFLRAGRIDSVIEVGKPNRDAAQRFVEVYGQDDEGRSLLADDVDMERVGEAFEGYVPAFIATGVNRAKVFAMLREGEDVVGKVTTDDLVRAAKSMRAHAAMAEHKSDGEPDPAEVESARRTIEAREGLSDTLSKLERELSDIKQRMR